MGVINTVEELFGKMKYVLGFILGEIECKVLEGKLSMRDYCDVKKHVDVIVKELNELLKTLKDIVGERGDK